MKKSLLITIIVLLCIFVKTLSFYKKDITSTTTTTTQIQDDSYFTVYKYASEKNKSPNTDSYEDKLDIADSVYHIGAIIHKIDQLAKENNYSNYQIINAELFGLKDDYHTACFTICFDNKDYYMIQYWSPEGAVFTKATEQTIEHIKADLETME